MDEFVIRAEHLSKAYTIRHNAQTARYATLQESLLSLPKRLLAKRESAETFWALKDVSFEIGQGERVGIIGRNGAGKSTLLKLLSKITEPTSGQAKINGRVASLLEVGTGFHPELTGRENIFMNGAILGMSRAEIKKNFDNIVAFAEVEKFVDTPVKRYSSGMYVRLAFAVAVHLNSEILLIDEVLAVGDVEFQKKCLGKMEEITHGGRTVLVVSHNMSTILGLSSRCLLLSKGTLLEQGPARTVVGTYQKSITNENLDNTDLRKHDRYGNGFGRFISIGLRAFGLDDKELSVPVTGCNLRFSVGIEAIEEIKTATVALIIYDDLGGRIIDANTLTKGDSVSIPSGRTAKVDFYLKNVRLRPGAYSAGLWLGILNMADMDGIQCATSFQIEPKREDTLYSTPFPGVYTCEFDHKIMIENDISPERQR
jgi:lipopolysaccharide transport system ATP-binding protein